MERHKCENSASVVLMLPVPSPGKGGGVFSCVIKVFYVVLTQRFCVTSTKCHFMRASLNLYRGTGVGEGN